VNEAILSDHVDDFVFFGDLHCDREIVGGLRRKKNIDRLLGENRLASLMVNLYNVKLRKVTQN
jgi:hypothetical protein